MASYPEGQTGLFRRTYGIVMALAIDAGAQWAELHPRMSSILADPTNAVLVRSSKPSMVDTLTYLEDTRVDRFQTLATLPSEPALLSLEIKGRRNRSIRARLRWGVRPPAVLGPADTTVALSDLVLFRLDSAGALPADLDGVLPRMLGTTSISSERKIGLFWETYGVQPGDTTQVSVSVVTMDGGVLRRMGSALGIVAASVDKIAIAWQEQRHTATSTPAAREVPISPASLSLDLSGLPRGRYSVSVKVSTRRGVSATAQRVLVLQ